MFYIGWISLTASGILVGILVFLWALKTEQFSDQGRARYLPLRDDFPMAQAQNPSKATGEVYALLFVIAIGLAAMATTVILTLMSLGG
ncbi:MAG: cbb3-type cytochrome oxidase assembly protein CcoS [Proteobacteria bacterium]|nr:cbb3-type cytochrome oxidase assembly protein CcoS [Pseudomonadota bacterium]NIS67869.1 cbb3-type cytochrome oxidase assembly protein CcoS [Pseudomonadota bacterium]